MDIDSRGLVWFGAMLAFLPAVGIGILIGWLLWG